jgi:uncharacterized protein YecT (DUF1311 family)/rhodanese-related sulfurtransferase
MPWECRMRTVLFRLAFLLPISASSFAAQAGDDKVSTAVSGIMTLCVGGGSTVTVHYTEQNQLEVTSGSGGLTLERHEAQGLIDGLNNSITALQADQANRVRDCIKPYLGEIVHFMLYPANPVSEPEARSYVPPPSAPSLLSAAHRTNFMEEAVDFGRVPTIGLNRNVNDYTPAYINGGSIISTGELEHAMGAGMRFALIDVLEAQHTPLPGARLFPGAGMVDDQNDLAKENWFVDRLLSITGGSYDYPIVVYCLGVRCWESFNAATRAIIGGFRNVYWYRGGVNAWFADRRPVEPPPKIEASVRVVAPDWCSGAVKRVEKLICGNSALASLDARLSDAYQASRNRLSSAGQQQIKRDELDWLQQRNACEMDPNMAACVEHAYRARLSELTNY